LVLGPALVLGPGSGLKDEGRTKDQEPRTDEGPRTDHGPSTKAEGRRLISISKPPEGIAGMFDAIAGRYDFLNHLLSAGIDRRWRKKAIRSLGLTGRERVLDLCTGTADVAIAAQTATPGAARVVGVDFAGAMLRIGRDKVA